MPLKTRRPFLPLGLTLGVLCATGVALAIPWSDFDDAFDPLPCPDGWAGCVIDGDVINPGMVKDTAGRPHPSDMRVGFFDLKPLPSLSPFVGLSVYTGPTESFVADADEPTPVDVPAPVESPAPVKADPLDSRPVVPVAQNTPGRTVPDRTAPDRTAPDRTAPDRTASDASSTGRISPDRGRPERPVITPTETRPTEVQPTSIRPEPVVVAPEPVVEPVVVTPEPVVEPTRSEPVAVAADSVPAPSRPAVADNNCDNLVSLEAPAMMGNLGVGRRKCLESRLSGSSQTSKNKISRVLISDAEARGDRSDWERLMKRHLEDIDRSDPNLCFTYAIHLSRGGAGRSHGVIRWADYALENKQQWSGTTYKKNVYAIYKLRARAANKLWQAAEAKYVEDRSDSNESAAKKYRDMTKNYGREWLDYARASSQSTKSPLSLCVSAAGSTSFCEG